MAKEGIFYHLLNLKEHSYLPQHTKEDIEKTIHAFDNALSRIV